MLVKQLSKLTIGAMMVLLLGSAALAQEEQQKSPWKDRAEYDMFQSIVQEKDPAKKVQLLDTYMEKYPETNFELQVRLMYVQTYQQLNDPEKTYAAAQDLLELDPDNVQGHYFITSMTMARGTGAENLAAGEKSAEALISILGGMSKPEGMDQAAWDKQKKSLTLLAHRTLGWIAMNRKNNMEAEKQFKQVLEIEPKDGQVSYWLGTVILAQRDPEKQSAAFFHFARAANLTGEGAMNDAGREKVGEYLTKIYTTFHGSEEGMDEMVKLALSQPFPPADFKVKSAQVIAVEKEEQLRRENPQLYMWRNVKKELTSPGGEEYFNSQVRNTDFPSMRGYLVGQSPQQRPDTLTLGIEGRGQREVTLKLNEAFRYPAGGGTPIRFECVPRSFTASPFNIYFECDKEKISGWPPPPSRQTTR